MRSGVRTVAELAGRLGVDGRTVRRYVDHLLDLDVPVESVRGRHGGYRFAHGYRMPPLMLNDEEALAVLLGLVAGRRARLMTATGTAGETAATKIRRVLPYRRVYCAMITPLVVVTLLVSSNSVSGAGPSNSRAPPPRASGQISSV